MSSPFPDPPEPRPAPSSWGAEPVGDPIAPQDYPPPPTLADFGVGVDNGERPPADPVTVAAFVIGGIGVLFLGIVCAIVTAVLAAESGKRARADGRSLENAYFAFVFAFIDGVFWIFLHYQFHLPIWAG